MPSGRLSVLGLIRAAAMWSLAAGAAETASLKVHALIRRGVFVRCGHRAGLPERFACRESGCHRHTE